jgi:hypothetical protein
MQKLVSFWCRTLLYGVSNYVRLHTCRKVTVSRHSTGHHCLSGLLKLHWSSVCHCWPLGVSLIYSVCHTVISCNKLFKNIEEIPNFASLLLSSIQATCVRLNSLYEDVETPSTQLCCLLNIKDYCFDLKGHHQVVVELFTPPYVLQCCVSRLKPHSATWKALNEFVI